MRRERPFHSKPSGTLRRPRLPRSVSPLRCSRDLLTGHGQDSWFLHPTGLDGLEARSPKVFGLRGFKKGAVAQLGERLICIQEVAGSIPTSSTRCRSLWACSSVG